MGTLAGELIKVSATSPAPVPSLGRVGRGVGTNLPETDGGAQQTCYPEACADMKSTGALAF